jgi:methyl-accepting chemotaxis protein
MEDRRKKTPFKKALQLRVVRYMVILAVFALLVLFVCIFFFIFWNPIASGLLLISDPFTRSAAQTFNNSVRSLFILFFALNFIFLWLTFTIAVRIVGPFVRINRVLEDIANGELPEEVRFRKGDEIPFQQLTDPFNRALAVLRNRKQELDAIKKEIDGYLASTKEGAPILQKIKARLEKLT